MARHIGVVQCCDKPRIRVVLAEAFFVLLVSQYTWRRRAVDNGHEIAFIARHADGCEQVDRSGDAVKARIGLARVVRLFGDIEL
ncbi:hypothetical protein SAHY_17269 [Salinisphaera hydrothermalis EPR70]